MSADRYAWMGAALCAQVGGDEWTEQLAGGGALAAKRICGRCPARPACTAHAAQLEQHDGSPVRGVWGGLSQNQRRQQTAA
ncbi:WhiB family transcriptional regulator [Streptomyces sp. NPDC127091]|uniref:WhiB family transcriptional regulator n=1 Tax=Streptomyces sp. NPDC127091 TaxID=3347134 RepID=UPI00364E6383